MRGLGRFLLITSLIFIIWLSLLYGQGPDYVIILIVFIQFNVFTLSLWMIFKLWMTVFEFLGKRTTERARILATFWWGRDRGIR